VLRKLIRASRKYDLTWRYGFNLKPTLAYKLKAHSISAEGARVLAELNRAGVAITSAERLLGPDSHYQELKEAVNRLEQDLAQRLAASRARADNSVIGEKTFLAELLGRRPVLEPENIYARFAIQQGILQIANAYFGMYTRLRYYNIWHTFPTKTPARESQLWHHDREDHYILKVFVHFSDIDEGAGPFTYARGSHLKGTLRRAPEYSVEGGVKRSNDQQMAEVVEPERWFRGVGPIGTIIFADTRGYHKGGHARERDRVMYTCMFTSQASESQEIFERPARMILPQDKAEAFALTARGSGRNQQNKFA
jgi:hypothetical protein